LARRLVEDRATSGDIDALYTQLADQRGCGPSIEDLRHFVHHRERRDRGLAFEHGHSVMASARYVFMLRRAPMDEVLLREAVVGRRNIVGRREPRAKAIQLKRQIERVLPKLAGMSADGTLQVHEQLHRKESRLLQRLLGTLEVRSLFTVDELIEELRSQITLLFPHLDVSRLKPTSNPGKKVALHAAAVMHGVRITKEKEPDIKLEMGIVVGTVTVRATSALLTLNAGFAFPFFDTKLTPNEAFGMELPEGATLRPDIPFELVGDRLKELI
jgi:hypothetical protein